MTKPFITIEEQVKTLQRRGLRVDSETSSILLRENYYSVINGYKTFFLDQEKTLDMGEDAYIEGTSFDEIYGLFLFDRHLRETTFHYIVRAEAVIKTVTLYSFCEDFPDKNAYLDIENYSTKEEYMLGESSYSRDLTGLVQMLSKKAYGDRKCKDFIRHYRNQHGDVPLWVLANDLTFGNVSYFFNLQQRSIQNRVCKRILELRDVDLKSAPYFSPNDMRLALRILVDFRNICAHDERLYCAKVGPGDRKEYDYSDLVRSLSKILRKELVDEMLNSVLDLAVGYTEKSPRTREILKSMGVMGE